MLLLTFLLVQVCSGLILVGGGFASGVGFSGRGLEIFMRYEEQLQNKMRPEHRPNFVGFGISSSASKFPTDGADVKALV